MENAVFLFGAGLIAGAMNALAGGGSFITLPALIAAGIPSVAANASSTVALYPASAASVFVYGRDGFMRVGGVPLAPTIAVTLVGGLAGSLLLLWTPTTLFDHALPWLLLLATLALAFGRQIGAWLRARYRAPAAAVLVIQFVLGVYGGYFGGAVGLMMMAAWSLLEGADIKSLNPPRVLLVTVANTVAVLCFIIAGIIHWPATLEMGLGAIGGGIAGAYLGRALPSRAVRLTTLLIAIGMTVAFFVRAYF
ncbi:MAG TPA: sulfite exporter TauE/SafE family protein [Xanthobacteraceae bacterium]|jgi:uncharacterized membrane protein YfcA|nr:sulfite exporter TauE/SafE family protein [Xanthobacteraceae bacterium]